jgi:SAM-dependent methyltransferase
VKADMADFWSGMEDDPDSLERIRRSVELLDANDGMSVLDVGCYRCVAKKFLKETVEYVGLDIERYMDGIVLADFDRGFKLPILFDRILCLEVLEHLKYPRRLLVNIIEHLKEDGILVVSLPNEATIFHRIRGFFGLVDPMAFRENGKHLHLPNISQARQFLSEHLTIIEEKPYIVLPISIPKTLRRILSISLALPSLLFPGLFSRGTIFKLRRKPLSNLAK